MAGVIEEIQFAMDQAAIDKLIAESQQVGDKVGKRMTDAIGTGGKDAARKAAVDIMGELERDLERNEARVKESLARGLISEAGAKRAAETNARAYNAGILRAMDELRQKGALTNESFVQMTEKLKNVGAASSEVDKVSTSTNRLMGLLTKVGGFLGGLFALHRIQVFGEQSIEEWKKDEAALDRLDSALRRMGTSADALSPQLRDLEGRMRALRLDEDETQEILGTLIGRTNKVAESFENVGLVVALARREHMDFASASQIVANLMNGNVIRLRQLGINATNATDALAELRRETLGEGEKWAATLEGRLTGLNVLWGNFKSAIGQAMVEAGGGTEVIDVLSGAIKAMTEWVIDNSDELGNLKNALVEVVDGFRGMWDQLAEGNGPSVGFLEQIHRMDDTLNKFAARITMVSAGIRKFLNPGNQTAFQQIVEARQQIQAIEDAATARQFGKTPDQIDGLSGGNLGAGGGLPTGPGGGGGRDALKEAADAKRAAQELQKAHDETIQNALKLLETEETRSLGLRILTKEEDALREKLQDSNLSLHDRVDTLQKLNDIQGTIAKTKPKFDEGLLGKQINQSLGIGEPVKTGAEATMAPDIIAAVKEQAAHATDNVPVQFTSVSDAFDDMLADMRDNSAEIADDIAGHFSDAFAQMRKDGFTLNSILSNLGKGLAKSILGEITKVAKGEALQALANAIKFTAIGLGKSALGDSKGAGTAFAAAGTFAKSAIAWGALAGAVGSIGGGGGGDNGGGSGNSGADHTSSIDRADKYGPEIHIYLDGVDPRNPRHQEIVGDANRRYMETTGGKIIYHPGV